MWLWQTGWHQKWPPSQIWEMFAAWHQKFSDERDERLFAGVTRIYDNQASMAFCILHFSGVIGIYLQFYDNKAFLHFAGMTSGFCLRSSVLVNLYLLHLFSISFQIFFSNILLKWCISEQNTQQCGLIKQKNKVRVQIYVAGMAYKPRGPPEVDKNRQKPRRVGLCEKYHRSDRAWEKFTWLLLIKNQL